MAPFKAFVKYRDPITSKDLNQARIGFFPKGRYLGFDKIEDSDTPGFVLSITNETHLTYYDEAGIQHKVGLAVNPQGAIIHFSGGYDINLSGITFSEDTYFVLILKYQWIYSNHFSPIIILAKPVGNMYPTNPDSYIGQQNYDIVLGVMKVSQGATNASGIELYPADAPQFAWGNEDLSQTYARLHFHNVFSKSQISALQMADQSSIDGNGFLHMPDTQALRLNLSKVSAIKGIILPLSQSANSRLIWISLNNNSYPLTLNAGQANFDIPKDITLRGGDSAILGVFGPSIRVLGAFSYQESKLENVAYTHKVNIWNWGQVKQLSSSISDKVLELTEDPVQMFTLDSPNLEIDRISALGYGLGVGMEFTIILIQRNNHNPRYLKIDLSDSGNKDRFLLNDGRSGEAAIWLREGIYTFHRSFITQPTPKLGWAISGNFLNCKYSDSEIILPTWTYVTEGQTQFSINLSISYKDGFYLLKGHAQLHNVSLGRGNVSLTQMTGWLSALPASIKDITLRYEAMAPAESGHNIGYFPFHLTHTNLFWFPPVFESIGGTMNPEHGFNLNTIFIT